MFCGEWCIGRIYENRSGSAARLPGSRVLEDSYQSNLAGVAVPKSNAGRLSYVSDFLDGMKRDGSLQRIIDGAELRGIEIVSPKAAN